MNWMDWLQDNADWYYQESSPTVYRCPEDSLPLRSQVTNYAASAGTPWGGGNDGLFRHESVRDGSGLERHVSAGVRPGAVKDGLSQTVAFCEALIADGSDADPRRTVVIGHELPEPNDADASWSTFLDDCLNAPVPSVSPTDFGSDWLNGSLGFSRLTHSLPPDRRSCLNGNNIPTGLYAPSGNHAGHGVHALLGDGSVRPIAPSIDAALWQAAGTVAGGEVRKLFPD